MYAIELRLRTNSCTNDVPYLYAFLICFMYKPLLSTVDTQRRRFTITRSIEVLSYYNYSDM